MPQPAHSAKITIRPARPTDILALTPLCAQLGYPSTADEVRARLNTIASTPQHALWVAETNDKTLAGFLNAFVMHTIDSNSRVEIAALVVDDAHRSQGVGPQLIAQAESWARENNCRAIGLRSNVIRDRAHKFYERVGYVHYKTQKAFRKSL